ncbi:DUF805 domain-containing protein [Spartinivicinus poritis]|uniref:DUF805 domain-containing protein n=1 Tax=Spartinivicinus poritis TaxID=2994640 RepID=A0ABT5UA15_9GAMM|nr:DUF805 domain-containing protein [Spartinivicinus sp. A2-2]MDE1463142.1 DUF805 domain-containing protein [Spartinivicinus sp. A2-2]
MINHPQWMPFDIDNIVEKQTVAKKIRLSRRQFAIRLVGCLGLLTLLSLVSTFSVTSKANLFAQMLLFLLLGVLLVSVVVLVKAVIMRLHDANISGALAIALLLFPIGSCFVLTLCFTRPGTEGDNYFGTDPRLK